MHKKALLILAIVALAAVLAAVWMTRERRASAESESGGPLVAGLKEAVNSITRVRLENAEQSVTLERGESGWRILERAGYPADLQQLRRKLIALSESKLLEKKTANPENYALLGVSDLPEEGAEKTDQPIDEETTLLTLEGLPEGLSLLLGKRNFRGNPSTFVRRVGQDQTWAASGDLSMAAKPQEWLKKDLLDIGAPRIQRVVLTHPEGGGLTMEKATREQPNFDVQNIPAGRELLSPSVANSIAGALGSLRLEDVRSAVDGDVESVAAVSGVFETFDGLRVRTKAWQQDDKRYLTLAIEFDESLIPPEPEPASEAADQQPPGGEPAVDQTAAGEPATAEAQADEDNPIDAEEGAFLASQAQALASAVEGWVFQIPSYKYANMTKRMDDLLKPLESDPPSE